MSDREQDRTLHCECGSEEYNIKWTYDGDAWAVCAECGRPTSTLGIGREKQLEWMTEHQNE